MIQQLFISQQQHTVLQERICDLFGELIIIIAVSFAQRTRQNLQDGKLIANNKQHQKKTVGGWL